MSQSRQQSRRVAVAVLLGVGMLFARAAVADTEATARKHAARANQLAAKNKCKAAIFAFTRALKTLKDPSLLFNRAECFRKVGRNDEAVTDYEQFLLELPSTPNRATVESRIVALKASAAPRQERASAQPGPPAPAGSPAPVAAPAPAAPAAPPPLAPPKPVPTGAPPAPAGPKPDDKAAAAAAPARKAEKWVD